MTFPISYDLAALMVRVSVGLALLPYPIKKFFDRTHASTFPKVLFLPPKAALYAAMSIEATTSVFLLLGLCTRLIVIPCIISMGYAFWKSRNSCLISPATLFFFMLIVILFIGAGQYSLDALCQLTLGNR